MKHERKALSRIRQAAIAAFSAGAAAVVALTGAQAASAETPPAQNTALKSAAHLTAPLPDSWMWKCRWVGNPPVYKCFWLKI
jgi:hypothetical protein